MKKSYSISLLAAFILLSITSTAKTWTITVKDFTFTPSNLTHVTARDTIKWVWEGGTHTTKSTTIPLDALDWEYDVDINNPIAIYVPTVNGTYTYICSIHPQMEGHFTVSGAQGISDEDTPGVSLFPNPFRDLLKVTLLDGITLTKMKVYDATGKIVLEKEINKQGTFVTYDLADLPRGIYFLSFTTRDNRIIARRVIHD